MQSTLIFVAVSEGFGTSIDLLVQEQINRIQTVREPASYTARDSTLTSIQLVTISDILYLITIYVSKCCVVGIYLRLTPQKTHNRISWATLVLCTLWIIPSALILAVNCEMNRPWKTSGGQCRNLVSHFFWKAHPHCPSANAHPAPTMGIHYGNGHSYRTHPLQPGSHSPPRPVHAAETKITNRLCLPLPTPVSLLTPTPPSGFCFFVHTILILTKPASSSSRSSTSTP